jgi:hypothetical protein
MDDFLNLSDVAISKINKIRKFCFGVYGSSHIGEHKRLKIRLNTGKSIEFSVLGSDFPVFFIEFDNKNITVSAGSGPSVRVMYSEHDDINKKLNDVLDLVIPNLLNKLGFIDCTESSDVVVSFLDKSIDELLVERFSNCGFNYIDEYTLIENACSDLGLKLTDLVEYNEDNSATTKSMLTILPKIVRNITLNDSVESKFKQLISLISFYNYLIDNDNNGGISFEEYSKTDLAPSAELDSPFCYVSLSDVLTIGLGNQLKPKVNDNILYEQIVDKESQYGYIYSFSVYIQDNNYSIGDKEYKYFTNDLDYIYSIVLNSIRNLINTTISNSDANITSRHVEVFKMAKF